MDANSFSEITPIRTEADAVHQQSLLGMEPVELGLNCIYAIRTLDGFKTIDLTKEEVLRNAGEDRSRLHSDYTFTTVDSFVAYALSLFSSRGNDGKPTEQHTAGGYCPYRRHALCIADESTLAIRLVFDSQPHQWGDVVSTLQLQKSPEALRWEDKSGKYLAQQDFAEFAELNLGCFHTPDAATVLEIAQTFQAKTTVEFGSAVRLANGAIKLKREEAIEAKAGERSDITIPEELLLGFPLFKYDQSYQVRARLRYRIVEGVVRLSVLLLDPEHAFEHAFCEVVDRVSKMLDMPVYWGKI